VRFGCQKQPNPVLPRDITRWEVQVTSLLYRPYADNETRAASGRYGCRIELAGEETGLRPHLAPRSIDISLQNRPARLIENR